MKIEVEDLKKVNVDERDTLIITLAKELPEETMAILARNITSYVHIKCIVLDPKTTVQVLHEDKILTGK